MSAPELVAGYVVGGKYAVRSLLLHGGAMATYRATGAKNREVAVKLYDPAILAFPDVLKALAQHQSVGAKLPPDQVLAITESGTDSNSGAPYTVTDFEQGPSLTRLVDRGPLSSTQMVALIRNLAAVTDLLHASGIAGISLHPANVFVRPGAQYEVRVGDFGASLVRNALPSPEAGRWMPWLAPEQIKAQTPPAQTTDVFALALLAFFAVTGKPYWRSSQLKAPDTAALRREILGERMPASVRASEFAVTLNAASDAVFARALAFKPADRYPTPREFAVGLEAALTGRPVAEVEAARRSSAGLAAASAGSAGVAPQRASSPGEVAAPGQRMAPPPPRKMPLRSTMVGVGQVEEPAAPPAAAPGPRPKLNTMLGMGDAAAQAVAAASAKGPTPGTAAPAKISAPEAANAPMRGGAPAKPAAPTMMGLAKPPAMPTAPAKPVPPPMPTTTPAKGPAYAAAAPTGVATAAMAAVAPAPSATPAITPVANTMRGLPPPLPMAPPPAEMEAVLASFEAAPPPASPAKPVAAAPVATSDAVQTPAWLAKGQRDSGAERVETGVAVIGTDIADRPRKSRMAWIAGACGLLILSGGGAWALLGGASSSRAHAASDPKLTGAVAARAAQDPPISVEPPVATAPTNADQPTAEEPQPAAPPEPVAQAVPPAPEPEQAEPAAPAPPPPSAHAAPIADNDTGAHAAAAPSRSTASSGSTGQGGSATPRPQQPKKPCGKFLKRCK